VALTRSSYGGPVDGPTVSQIRGVANQCPPDDSFLPHLMEFFRTFGSGWKIEGHRVGNFDCRCDGDLVMGRWAHLRELQDMPTERASSGVSANRGSARDSRPCTSAESGWDGGGSGAPHG
jgi:hypothetical protein